MQNIWKSEFYNQMAKDLGEGIAYLFAEQFGGQKLYIPKIPQKQHPIAKVLGIDLLSWLCGFRGGEVLKVPLGPASLAEKRKRKAIFLVAQGCSINKIATELNISYNQAQALKKQADPL